MSADLSSLEFWESDASHIAVNPHQPEAADGLTNFAESLAPRGLCFFQTSGSEGRPKWVGLAKEAFLISGRAVNAHFEATSSDRWLLALPLHHVGGFAIYARAILTGAKVVRSQMHRWDPAVFAHECADQRITLVSLVPAQVHDLVRARATSPTCLRAAIIGGGGMAQGLADEAAELGWRVFQSYGMTEAASQIATQPYDPNGPAYDVSSLEVLPHWQLDQDAAGRLIVRGQALAKGNARREGDGVWTWEAIDPQAGLTTRDFVKLWTHGTRRFLSFAGRETGYVKILGELIHLAPLQTRLEDLARQRRTPAVPIITAVADPRRDSALVLVAEQIKPGEVGALVSAFNAATPPLCHLQGMVILDRIPRSDLGKVDAVALAAAVRAAEIIPSSSP